MLNHQRNLLKEEGEQSGMTTERLIIGISGASGAIYGIRLLEVLRELDTLETHLIISKSAQITITQETGYTLDQVKQLADLVHPQGDVAACISSGSYQTLGMILAPCSMRSLGEIANGIPSNLLTRAADVVLKERRRLLLMVRETPLHSIHLRNMATVSDAGGVIMPPVPAFYQKPESVDDIVNHTVGRALDMFDLPHELVKRWQGL